MGNSHSCCITSSKSRKYADESYTVDDPEPQPALISSSSNLQHIADREPDDSEYDPSSHPTASTLFLVRSKSEIVKTTRSRRRLDYDHFFRIHKKYSSCSTIYLDDSTVSQPNLKNTIKAVALAIYFHIRNNRFAEGDHILQNSFENHIDSGLLEIFDEKAHPLSKDQVPDDYYTRNPEQKAIYRFIRTLFTAAQLTAECAIVTLVYLERLLTYAAIEIIPGNWKRIVLGAILLASKVWDDQAVWNVDYCQILKDTTVEDMNELERQFLEMLQFNINVPSSVYAKYYFELRTLAEAHDLVFPLEPLTRERAAKLEAMSSSNQEKFRQGTPKLKRSQSLDGLILLPRLSRAILS